MNYRTLHHLRRAGQVARTERSEHPGRAWAQELFWPTLVFVSLLLMSAWQGIGSV